MEFKSIQHLKSDAPKGSILPFSITRTFPRIRVDEKLELIEDEENLNNFAYTIAQGSAVANIRRVQTTNILNPRTNFPMRVLLETTSACNFACRMCPRQTFTRSKNEHMPFAKIVEILDELNSHGLAGLWLYHIGESFLHPEALAILEKVSTYDNLGNIWLSSNLSLLDDKNIFALINSSVTFLNLSLHGVTAESYTSVVPGGDYEKIMKIYYRLLELRGNQKLPFIRVQMIEQETTKHEIEPFMSMHYQQADIVSINMLEYITISANKFGKTQRECAPSGHCKRIAGGDCIICANGVVAACDEAADALEEKIGKLYLGNIHEQSLYEIWNGERRREVVELEQAGKLTTLPLCAVCGDHDF